MAGVNWAKGVGYSILASLVGGASKLAIRKSWLMVEPKRRDETDSSSPDVERDIAYERASDIIDQNVNGESRVGSPSAGPLSGESYESPLPRRRATTTEAFQENDITVNENESVRNLSSTHTQTIAITLRLSGMVGMTFLNPLFCVLAMNYASPSILAPFSGLTLVWIVLFSESFIGEKPQKKQIIAASLIIIGEVIVAAFGDHTNDEGITVADVAESYANPYFQFYFVAMAAWFAGLIYLIVRKPTPALRRFAFGVAGGSLTGFQNFLKDSLTIIKAVGETGEPYPWYFYFFVIFAMGSAFGGLLFLTGCMKEYDATFSSAMFVGSFVISASIMSAVHYETFQHLVGIQNWILYPAGLVILMIGVDLLVKATSEHEIEFDTARTELVARSSDSSSSRDITSSLLGASVEPVQESRPNDD